MQVHRHLVTVHEGGCSTRVCNGGTTAGLALGECGRWGMETAAARSALPRHSYKTSVLWHARAFGAHVDQPLATHPTANRPVGGLSASALGWHQTCRWRPSGGGGGGCISLEPSHSDLLLLHRQSMGAQSEPYPRPQQKGLHLYTPPSAATQPTIVFSHGAVRLGKIQPRLITSGPAHASGRAGPHARSATPSPRQQGPTVCVRADKAAAQDARQRAMHVRSAWRPGAGQNELLCSTTATMTSVAAKSSK